MGVMIELTAEQEAAVLAAYELEEDGAGSVPAREPKPEPEAVEADFEVFYGIEFGAPSNGKNKDLPMTTNDGLVTWRFYVGDDLAALGGVNDHGGDFHVHQVQDELAKWPVSGGYEDIVTKIEGMGLDDTDFAVFPENIGQVTLYPVAYGDQPWALEMWQENTLRFTLTGPGLVPPEMFKFTLYQSGSKLGLQYYWK